MKHLLNVTLFLCITATCTAQESVGKETWKDVDVIMDKRIYKDAAVVAQKGKQVLVEAYQERMAELSSVIKGCVTKEEAQQSTFFYTYISIFEHLQMQDIEEILQAFKEIKQHLSIQAPESTKAAYIAAICSLLEKIIATDGNALPEIAAVQTAWFNYVLDVSETKKEELASISYDDDSSCETCC
jgi:hypothetical protein